MAWFTSGAPLRRLIALVLLCAGALPFVNNASARTKDEVGLTYGSSATVNAAYLWRGIYAGGPCLQVDANVGYGGLYANMWWSLGATDMSLKHFLPELDLTLGFKRWGLNVFLLYIHNFDCRFFDFGNHVEHGNRLELIGSYTVSPKIPLRVLWGTRVGAADGYFVERVTDEGLPVTEVVRAWSSYLEVSYNWQMRDGWSLYGAIGMTPWRSCYTGYQKGAVLNNIELHLRKDWSIHERCGLMLMGQMVVNPSTELNVINLNIACGVYLK